MLGREGCITYGEVRGHLTKRLLVQSSPKVAPIMHVAAATYGLTPTARRDRLEAISRELRKVAYIEHRIREGRVVLVSSHECYLSRLFITTISSCVWVYVWVSLYLSGCRLGDPA